ncbi:hypothetical protein SRABI128_04971 [Microbacterium sp. Bi128]|nr:hypothetical protein SRABI128_04971 [Microbacterium sp. Bi128]
MPQRYHLAVEAVDRLRIIHLGGGVDVVGIRVHRDPGCPGGEAGMPGGVPLDRGPRVVPVQRREGGEDLCVGVAQVRGGFAVVVEDLDVAVIADRAERHVGHAQFFTLVDVGRAAVQVQDAGQHFGGERAVSGAVVAEAGHGAGLVVVAPVQAVPARLGQPVLPAAQGPLQLGEQEFLGPPLVAVLLVQRHVLELKHHVHLGPGGVGVQDGVVHGHAGHFADGEQFAGALREDFPVHLLQELVHAGAVDVERGAVTKELAVGHRAVRERGVLGDEVDDVHPEPVHASVQPPVHHLVDRGADLRILPVQVRLLLRKDVQVVLPGGLVELPRGPGERRAPVGRLRRLAPRGGAGVDVPRRPPPVPVALRVLLRGPGFHEPRVLVRGVVDHQVHHQLHAARVQPVGQFPELLEGTEQRVHVPVVADVIAVVVLRGGVDRGEPDDVDPQPLAVVQHADDAAEVADAVAVGVGKAARIDLIDDGALEPVAGSRLGCFRGGFFDRHGDSSAGPADKGAARC